ncbi:Protein SCARECROW, partial [Dissostichus eleginoides]
MGQPVYDCAVSTTAQTNPPTSCHTTGEIQPDTTNQLINATETHLLLRVFTGVPLWDAGSQSELGCGVRCGVRVRARGAGAGAGCGSGGGVRVRGAGAGAGCGRGVRVQVRGAAVGCGRVRAGAVRVRGAGC